MLLPTPSPDISVFDVNRNCIFWYGINEKGQAVPKETTQAAFQGYMLDIAFMSDSLFAMNTDLGAATELWSLNDSLPRKSRVYRSPEIGDPNFDPNSGFVFANESRIALVYVYKKQIDFLDADLNLMKSAVFEYEPATNIESSGRSREAKQSYVNAYFGKRYFYALFWGRSENEHKANSYQGALLEVFDLDGNPVAKYHLDGMGPDCFSVDEETFTLYGAIYNDGPEDSLLKYKLKGLL